MFMVGRDIAGCIPYFLVLPPRRLVAHLLLRTRRLFEVGDYFVELMCPLNINKYREKAYEFSDPGISIRGSIITSIVGTYVIPGKYNCHILTFIFRIAKWIEA